MLHVRSDDAERALLRPYAPAAEQLIEDHARIPDHRQRLGRDDQLTVSV